MTLNREIQDFLGAFSVMDRIATNRSKREYYRNKAGGGNVPTNPNSPAGQWVSQQAGPMPPGTLPQMPTSGGGGLLARAGNWVGRQLGVGGAASGGGGGSSGAVPLTGPTGDPAPLIYSQGDPLDDPMMTYAGGGSVSDDPTVSYGPDQRLYMYPEERDVTPRYAPFQLGGGQGSPMPPFTNTPRPEPAVPVPPVTSAGKPAGGSARKALGDQTRTEAYDPDVDGPGAAPVSTRAQETSAVPTQPAAPTRTMATPQSPDMQGNQAAGLSTNNAASDLEAALHGGLTFAQNTFHLGNQTDPHHQGGKEALFSGVGAATPDVVKAMDQKVNNGVPYDPQLYNVRRLEAIYRWYSLNGETDKANKAAFELLQYSAGVAAQWGTRGVQQIQQGDLPGAIKSVQEGYNHVPDGNHMTVQGNTATIVDKRTGQTVQQFQFTPEEVFNAAMGLSNRSLYWQVLAQRVSQTQKGAARPQTPDQQELTRARIENVRARTDRLKRTPIKGAGAAGPSDAMKQLIDKINSEEGGSSASPKANKPPEGGGDVDNPAMQPPEPADVEMVQDEGADEGADEGTGVNAGGKPTQAETVAPDSVVRVKPAQPGSAASSIPASPVTEKVRAQLVGSSSGHPGYEEGVTHGPDVVPDIVVSRSGEQYVPATKRGQPEPFGEAAPAANPYAKYAAEVAKLPPKERTAVQALLNQKQKAYDKQVADYKARGKAHIAAENKRLDAELKTGQQQQKEELKAALGYNLRPADVEAIEANINGAYQQAAQKNPEAVKQWGEPGRIQQIAFEIAKMNKLPADQALRLAGELTNIDPDQPYARTYVPRGRDVLGNVVVTTQNDGPLHIAPHVYKNIVATIQKAGRVDQAGRDAKAAAAAAPKPMDKLREAGKAFAKTGTPLSEIQRARRQAPASPTENVAP